MTTLQLAARIAEAATDPPPGCTPAQAVLGTLYKHRCWFVRVREVDGLTVEKPMPKPRGPKNTPLPFDEAAT
jgi:hypothetical protein